MPDVTRATESYKNTMRDRVDRYLFLFTWILGSLVGIALKLVGAAQLVVVLVPLLFMLVYALVLWRSSQMRIKDDRAGDSIYYLGFLYTMGSLAYSLWEFGVAKEDVAASVITNFGVALTTTILGMALRVAFQQMREDPDSMEASVRMELTSAAARFRTELQQAVVEFGVLRTTVAQTIKEASEQAATATTTAIQAVAAKAGVALEEETEEFRQAVGELSEDAKTVAGELGGQFKTINRATKRTVDAIEKLAAKIEALDVPPDLLSGRLRALMDDLAALVESTIAKCAQQAPELDKLVLPIASVQVAMWELTQLFGVLREKLEAERDSSREAQTRLEGAFKALREALEEATRAYVAYGEQQQTTGTEVWERERQGVKAALETLGSTVEVFTTAIANTNETYVATAERQKDSMGELRQSAERELTLIRSHQRGLEESVVASTASLRELQQTLVSMAQLMTKAINA